MKGIASFDNGAVTEGGLVDKFRRVPLTIGCSYLKLGRGTKLGVRGKTFHLAKWSYTFETWGGTKFSNIEFLERDEQKLLWDTRKFPR